MRLKLIVALVGDEWTDKVVEAAREKGATGATIITSVRGEGLKPQKTFLGLDLAGQRDVVLFIVAEEMSRDILEEIAGRASSIPSRALGWLLSCPLTTR